MTWTYGCNDHIELRSVEDEIKQLNWKSTGYAPSDFLSLCTALALTPHPALRRALENSKENSRLSISSIHLDIPTVKLLMYIISQFPIISDLRLSNVDLDTGLLREISARLPTNLKSLTLVTLPPFESSLVPNLPIDQAEADRKSRDGSLGAVGNFFGNFFSETSPLESLTLRQCRLTSEIFAPIFRSPQLKHLNFYDNPLGDSGVGALARAISGVSGSLVSLCVAKCEISDQGLSILLRTLSGKSASAEEISDFDKKFKEAEAKAKKAKQPVVMSEDVHVLGDRKFLFRFTNFRHLHVGYNPIKSLDAEILPLGYKNPLLSVIGCPVADTLSEVDSGSTQTSGWVVKLTK